jgi:serine/threonine protein kinase
MAPEVHTGKYSYSADMYSLSYVLYTLLVWKPCEDSDLPEFFDVHIILCAMLTLKKWPNIVNLVYNKDQNKRLSAEKVSTSGGSPN